MKFTAHKMFTFIGIWLLLTSPMERPVRADTNARNCTNKTLEKTIAEAVTTIAGLAPADDLRKLFAHALQLRGTAVPNDKKPKYWEEMKTKPELANTTIYGAGSAESQEVLKIIRPALTLYQRDWDVAVIKQDAPFAGVFRQCIFIVSTGLLRLVSDEELMGFAAHELAHECFVEELREADRLHCAYAYQLVEFKCDLVATLACLLLKDDPLSIASGIARIEAYYLNVDPSALRENKHPKAQHRWCCIEKFLARIRHGASAASRHGP